MRTSSVAEDEEFVECGRNDEDEDEDDEGMDEDDQAAARALPVPHIVTPASARSRGRFLGRSASVLASSRDRFDSVPGTGNNSPHGGPQRSIEGWILLVSGVKEDAEETDIYDAFCDFGHVKDLHFNLERRTGYGKGYALVEYESFEEAQTAIKAMDGKQLLTKTIHVDWAFNRGPIQKVISTRPVRSRSRTPPRRLAALTY